MKKDTQQKLKNYFLTAGSITLSMIASSQVMYTDINPDTVLNLAGARGYAVNFNADADEDIGLSLARDRTIINYSFSAVMPTYPILGQAVRGINLNSSYPYSFYPLAIDLCDSITSSNADWEAPGINTSFYLQYQTTGNWLGQSDKYLGVRFAISGQLHYGWIRMSLTGDNDSLIIKDYAYQATPSVGLVAGQCIATALLPDQEVLDPKVHVYERTLFVNLPANFSADANIRIYNSAGQLVHQYAVNTFTMRMDLNNLNSGIYFVQVEHSGQSFTRKVYVN